MTCLFQLSSADGVNVIATKLRTPLMLDSYTSSMCTESWGRLGYARALIELWADLELKESMVVAIPRMDGKGNILHTIRGGVLYARSLDTVMSNALKISSRVFLGPKMLAFDILGSMADEDEERWKTLKFASTTTYEHENEEHEGFVEDYVEEERTRVTKADPRPHIG
ncbi:hypothetical protein Tco_0784066 [Tanacetum coccineum]